jgi:magnesium transporter
LRPADVEAGEGGAKMITIWKQSKNQLSKSAILERDCWLQVTDPTVLEKDSLTREYGIDPETIRDILDIDERSRYEREESYRLIIYRIPISSSENLVPYHTIPLGIILTGDIVITVCGSDPESVRRIGEQAIKGYALNRRLSFVLRLFQSGAEIYLRYLKEINRRTTGVEKDLQRSIKNNELIRLLDMEKALVFFTTSLKSNELVIEKMRKTVWKDLSEEEENLLEDVITENKQAVEMANIYSNILSGMMDAFASVISNNLNTVMKRLTMISIALMIPTLFASLYGMNIAGLPFANSPFSFFGIVGVSVISAGIGAIFFARAGKLR